MQCEADAVAPFDLKGMATKGPLEQTLENARV